MAEEQEESLRGCFLVSNSTIQDPNFTNTVVLVIDHDENGAFGLIVNRQGEVSLAAALEQVPDQATDVTLYQGGPVRQDALFILHGEVDSEGAGDEVIEGVYMSSDRDLLNQLLVSDVRFHVYHGYSGWGSGQLESEIKMKTWVVVKATEEMVFHPDPEQVWREALAFKGGLYGYFAANVKDPFMN